VNLNISYAAVFWGALVASLAVAYAAIGAGIAGVLPLEMVSVTALVGALIGSLAALGYLISANQELERRCR
jgi:hypothetical protein